MHSRPLSKLHLLAKIALFGIFAAKFLKHMHVHLFEIFPQICTKIAYFIKQSEFRKRSNIRALLAYDGSAYLGWQKTQEGPSIEETLQHCLHQILQEEVTLQAASRTDAGVHARGQVINFHTRKGISLEELKKALSALLPPDIALLSMEQALPSFHPSLDSRGKEYHYHLCTTPIQNPLRRHFSWHFYYPLDLTQMRRAADQLLGTHDFTSFCNLYRNNLKNRDFDKKGSQNLHAERGTIAERQGQSENANSEINPTPSKTDSSSCFGIYTDHPLCTLTAIRIEEDAPGQLKFTIQGDRFLYKMVRNLVGTLAYIGSNKLPSTCISALLKNKDRTLSGITAPAHGLFLEKVFY